MNIHTSQNRGDQRKPPPNVDFSSSSLATPKGHVKKTGGRGPKKGHVTQKGPVSKPRIYVTPKGHVTPDGHVKPRVNVTLKGM